MGDNVEDYQHNPYGYHEHTYPLSKNEYTHIWDQQGSPCLLDNDVIHSQQNVPLPPAHDAPLLPKSRTTHCPAKRSHSVNNNPDSFLDFPPPPAAFLTGDSCGDTGQNLDTEIGGRGSGGHREGGLRRSGGPDSTGSAPTGLSKYYVLNKST